jgi:transposase
MPRKIILRLTEEDRRLLTRIARRDENWRVRERAQTVLYFDEDHSAEAVAELMRLHVRTVSSTRTAWLAQGIESLPDRPRVGAPQKLEPQQSRQLVEWAREQPGSARDLQNRLESKGGPHVHLNTIRATLHRAGMVFKRTRHSLKKNEMK